MSHSLNEIDAQAKRAARGAGLSWGISEETGKAVRWLSAHDLPGVATLAALLERIDQVPAETLAPKTLDGVWASFSGPLCPLLSGAALNDCADLLSQNREIRLKNVLHPILLVPFAAWAALHIKAPVAVSWLKVRFATDGRALEITGPEGERDVPHAEDVTCKTGGALANPEPPSERGRVSSTAWARLGEFAQRTYAPATEQSRLLGAGAGVSDND